MGEFLLYASEVGGNKEYIARINFSRYLFIDTWSFYEAPNRLRSQPGSQIERR